jgi:hypothetical protein
MVAALERVPFEQYVKSPALHATALKYVLTSPLAYRYNLDHPKEDNDRLTLGRACHTAVLEPDRFLREYVLWEGGRRFGKQWESFREANNAKTILTVQQYEEALRIRDAVRGHRAALNLLSESGGKSEVTLKWEHPRTGLKCKGRVDWLCSSLVDLKTTRNPDPRKFEADAGRLGYVFQLAFYLDGIASVLGKALPAKIIAVQSVAPYDVVVYDVPEDVLAVGHEQVERAIDLVAQCTAANDWPGIAADEVPLRLPAWATADFSDDEPQLTFDGQAL